MNRLPIRLLLCCLASLGAAVSSLHAADMSATPFKPTGIYALGEKVGWTVSLTPGTAPAPGGYTYTMKENNAEVLKTGTLDLAAGPATIDFALNEPAMVYVMITPTGMAPPPNAKADPHTLALGAAVAPDKIQPSVPAPADFDAFWTQKLQALHAVPINPVLTPMPSGNPNVDLYVVQLDSLGSHVHGYLAKPKRDGKFPALMIYQWAGVYALQPAAAVWRASQGWIVFNVDSHDLAPDVGTGIQNDYQTIGNTDRDKSYFLAMYLRDTRAIDYMVSQPAWNGKTLVVTGGSMGGQQSLATAGLNPYRVTAVIVNEPAGADSNGWAHGRATGYPYWPPNNPEAMKTALYFDVVNFAARIKAPTLVSMGFIDTTATPVGIWAALGQIKGPKEAVPMIESDHNNVTPDKVAPFEKRSEEVFAEILATGVFHPDETLTQP